MTCEAVSMRVVPTHDPVHACPLPSDRRVALRVTPDAERLLRSGHPWLYDNGIRSQRHHGAPGDLAVVFDRRNRFLAIGLYDPTSPIRVRILQHRRPAPIDSSWYAARFSAAAERRIALQQSGDTTAYRLIHGENDRLPGLVVDRYDDTLVLKLYTLAWIPHLRIIMEALRALWAPQRVVLRLSRAVQAHPAKLFGLADGVVLAGSAAQPPVRFLEHGLRFEADPIRGQKTGYFLDQRDNRARVEHVSAGRLVLDAFAYTGGFSVHAARGGAREVWTLDASRPAHTTAERHMALNRHDPHVAAAKHRTLAGDAFDVLASLARARTTFDVVVLDPPSFATREQETRAALSAYTQLTRLGLGVLRPNGHLVMACCSSHVRADDFFRTVHRAAAASGRPLGECERTGHPLDHPVGFREGAYLKCLIATAPAAQMRSLHRTPYGRVHGQRRVIE